MAKQRKERETFRQVPASSPEISVAVAVVTRVLRAVVLDDPHTAVAASVPKFVTVRL